MEPLDKETVPLEATLPPFLPSPTTGLCEASSSQAGPPPLPTMGEVRDRVLAMHRELRCELAEVQRWARGAAVAPAEVPELRARLRALLLDFRVVLDAEEELLAPVLLGLDDWGPLRVLELHEQHEVQRGLVESILVRAANMGSAHALTVETDRLMLGLFRQGEEGNLREALLHDDLVLVDQSSG